MLNFGQKVEERSQDDVVPKGSLAWCSVKLRGIKNSRQTNGQYLDIELTILPEQPYAGRKIWDTIADAYDSNNSQEYRDMGIGKIRRILEAAFGAKPDNPASYNLSSYEQLNGLTVPIYIDIQKGKNGYEDKNIPDYLSPWSSVKKVVESYNMLKSGVYKHEKPGTAKQAGQPQTGGFTPPTAAAGANQAGVAPSFLQSQPAMPAGNPPAPAGQAFQNSPAQAGPGWLAPASTPEAAAPAHQPAAVQPQQQAAPIPQQQGAAPAPQSNGGFAPAADPQSQYLPGTNSPSAPPVTTQKSPSDDGIPFPPATGQQQ